MSSAVVILAFSLLAYTFVYNFRTAVARRFAILLACVMVVYAGDVALTRAASEASAERWLRFQWLGIALMPAAYYSFSLAVLATTNYRIQRRQWVQWLLWVIALVGAFDALFGRQIVDSLLYAPPNSYLEAGPFFGVFALFFTIGALLALGNILKARSRCITPGSRKRINYLLFAFVAPGVGVFPYLIALGRVSPNVQSSLWVPVLSILGNGAVAFLLLLLSYTVAYFGVLTPDRVVRYRLIRFFMRGPFVDPCHPGRVDRANGRTLAGAPARRHPLFGDYRRDCLFATGSVGHEILGGPADLPGGPRRSRLAARA
jgi:hypothetical protein